MPAPFTRRLTAAYALPVALDALKEHLRLDGTADDDYVTELGKAAGQLWEDATGQPVMQADYVAVAASWQRLTLRGVGVTATRVAYQDENNAEADLLTDFYRVSDYEPNTLYFLSSSGQPLPTLYRHGVDGGAVRVYYTAGAATVDDVPPVVRQFVRLMVAHWYENRQEVLVGLSVAQLPMGAQQLINLEREPVL